MSDLLCVLCLCKMDGPSLLPCCQSCYDEVLNLPKKQRMEMSLRISELDNSRRLSSSLGRLTDNVSELIQISRSFSSFRLN